MMKLKIDLIQIKKLLIYLLYQMIYKIKLLIVMSVFNNYFNLIFVIQYNQSLSIKICRKLMVVLSYLLAYIPGLNNCIVILPLNTFEYPF